MKEENILTISSLLSSISCFTSLKVEILFANIVHISSIVLFTI